MSLKVGDNLYIGGYDLGSSFPVSDISTSMSGGWGSNPSYSAIVIDGHTIIFNEAGDVVAIDP